MSKNFVSINSLSTEDRSKLKSAISEINDSMVRCAAEKDVQKEFVDKVSTDLGLDKKLVRRLAKAYYKSNFNNEVADFETFEQFYALLFTQPTVSPTVILEGNTDE